MTARHLNRVARVAAVSSPLCYALKHALKLSRVCWLVVVLGMDSDFFLGLIHNPLVFHRLAPRGPLATARLRSGKRPATRFCLRSSTSRAPRRVSFLGALGLGLWSTPIRRALLMPYGRVRSSTSRAPRRVSFLGALGLGLWST